MFELHRKFWALGSPCELKLYGDSEDQLEEVASCGIDEIKRIETKYSRYREDSLLSQINQNAGSGRFTALDPETKRLFDYARTAFDQSAGLFDITSGVLRRAWDFKSDRLPSRDLLLELCQLVGFDKIEWRGLDRGEDKGEIHLPNQGMEIDFGGFGKEYAADRLAGWCREGGLRSGLVDLGGDVCVIGPHPDGSPWQVGIRDPRDPDSAIASLSISRGALATSGDYERFMEIDGKRYCHLLDPRTGWPVSGLAGVTVVADQCLVAGTATTIAMLKGGGGKRWLSRLGLPYLYVDQFRRTGGSLWPQRNAKTSAATASQAGAAPRLE